jgi:hypothetical protein
VVSIAALPVAFVVAIVAIYYVELAWFCSKPGSCSAHGDVGEGFGWVLVFSSPLILAASIVFSALIGIVLFGIVVWSRERVRKAGSEKSVA